MSVVETDGPISQSLTNGNDTVVPEIKSEVNDTSTFLKEAQDQESRLEAPAKVTGVPEDLTPPKSDTVLGDEISTGLPLSNGSLDVDINGVNGNHIDTIDSQAVPKDDVTTATTDDNKSSPSEVNDIAEADIEASLAQHTMPEAAATAVEEGTEANHPELLTPSPSGLGSDSSLDATAASSTNGITPALEDAELQMDSSVTPQLSIDGMEAAIIPPSDRDLGSEQAASPLSEVSVVPEPDTAPSITEAPPVNEDAPPLVDVPPTPVTTATIEEIQVEPASTETRTPMEVETNDSVAKPLASDALEHAKIKEIKESPSAPVLAGETEEVPTTAEGHSLETEVSIAVEDAVKETEPVIQEEGVASVEPTTVTGIPGISIIGKDAESEEVSSLASSEAAITLGETKEISSREEGEAIETGISASEGVVPPEEAALSTSAAVAGDSEVPKDEDIHDAVAPEIDNSADNVPTPLEKVTELAPETHSLEEGAVSETLEVFPSVEDAASVHEPVEFESTVDITGDAGPVVIENTNDETKPNAEAPTLHGGLIQDSLVESAELTETSVPNTDSRPESVGPTAKGEESVDPDSSRLIENAGTDVDDTTESTVGDNVTTEIIPSTIQGTKHDVEDLSSETPIDSVAGSVNIEMASAKKGDFSNTEEFSVNQGASTFKAESVIREEVPITVEAPSPTPSRMMESNLVPSPEAVPLTTQDADTDVTGAAFEHDTLTEEKMVDPLMDASPFTTEKNSLPAEVKGHNPETPIETESAPITPKIEQIPDVVGSATQNLTTAPLVEIPALDNLDTSRAPVPGDIEPVASVLSQKDELVIPGDQITTQDVDNGSVVQTTPEPAACSSVADESAVGKMEEQEIEEQETLQAKEQSITEAPPTHLVIHEEERIEHENSDTSVTDDPECSSVDVVQDDIKSITPSLVDVGHVENLPTFIKADAEETPGAIPPLESTSVDPEEHLSVGSASEVVDETQPEPHVAKISAIEEENPPIEHVESTPLLAEPIEDVPAVTAHTDTREAEALSVEPETSALQAEPTGGSLENTGADLPVTDVGVPVVEEIQNTAGEQPSLSLDETVEVPEAPVKGEPYADHEKPEAAHVEPVSNVDNNSQLTEAETSQSSNVVELNIAGNAPEANADHVQEVQGPEAELPEAIPEGQPTPVPEDVLAVESTVVTDSRGAETPEQRLGSLSTSYSVTQIGTLRGSDQEEIVQNNVLVPQVEEPTTTPIHESLTLTGEGAKPLMSEIEHQTPSESTALLDNTVSSLPDASDVKVDPISVEGEPLTTEREDDRPRSPWMPSFQVTTVGQGVFPDENHVEASIPTIEEGLIVPDETQPESLILDVPAIVTSTSEIEKVPEAVTPQLFVDTSSLEHPAESTQPWTPSYSVHSQGSPLHTPTNVDEENPVEPTRPWTPSYSVHSQGSPHPAHINLDEDQDIIPDSEERETEAELDVMEFANNEEIPITSENTQASQEVTDTVLIPDTRDTSDGYVNDEVLSNEKKLVQDISMPENSQVPHLVLSVNEETKEPPTSSTESLQSDHNQEQPTSPWIASYSVDVQGSPSYERSNPLEEPNSDSGEKIPSASGSLPSTIKPAANSSLESEPIAIGNLEIQTPQSLPAADLAESHGDSVVAINNKLHDTPALVKPDLSDELSSDLVANNSISNETRTETDHDVVALVDNGESNIEVHREVLPNPKSSANYTEEQPKNPWTPSYSVTTQGPATTTEQQLDKSESLPTSAVSADKITTKDKAVSAEPEPSTPDPATTETMDKEENTPTAPKLELPSEDSNGVVVVPVTDVDALHETFPAIKNGAEESQKLHKPSISRLIPLDAATSTESAPLTLSSTTRTRHESNTSSRFFPGAWFSPTHKAVDEGRTSLEVAQGEFTPIKSTPTDDLPDSPDLDDAASVESEDTIDSGKDRRRWCVVM